MKKTKKNKQRNELNNHHHTCWTVEGIADQFIKHHLQIQSRLPVHSHENTLVVVAAVLQLDGRAQIHQQCVKDGLLLLCLFCKLASKSAEELTELRRPCMSSHITTRQVEVGGEQQSGMCVNTRCKYKCGDLVAI